MTFLTIINRMAKRKFADELDEDELKDLFIDRKILGRSARIASYRANGRAVNSEDTPINHELNRRLSDPKNEPRSGSSPKRKIDRILLAVEICAVIGVLWIFFRGVQTLNRINREASESMILPTLTPTAIISAVVLPGSHTPPDESGAASFNEAEIPAHLRSLIVQGSSAPLQIPEGRARPIRVRIPAINVDAPVNWGDDWNALKTGVGENAASVEPGQAGNLILSAHNDIFGQLFRDLDQLRSGDEIILLTEKQSYTYTVQETKIVQPNQVEVMSQTADATVTLISCYPYLIDNQRIVVTGKYD